MLTDLIQYFTKIEDRNVGDNQITALFRSIQKYTLDDEIRTCVEMAVVNYNEQFFDLLEYGLTEVYEGLIHWEDFFNYLDYSNIFLVFIFSMITERRNYDILYADCSIGEFYDDDLFLESYKDVSLCHKCDEEINRIITDYAEGFTTNEGQARIDYYYNDVVRIVVSRIIFNKSIGRKVRKAYVKDSDVRDMFNELQISMINGQFIILLGYDIEESGYQDQIDFETVCKGVQKLRKILKVDNVNEAPISFKMALNSMNAECIEYCHTACKNTSNFIDSLLRIHKVSKREVIL